LPAYWSGAAHDSPLVAVSRDYPITTSPVYDRQRTVFFSVKISYHGGS
jgi:hypothetical protein